MGKISFKERMDLEKRKYKMFGDIELKPEVHRRALQHQIWINFGLIIALFGVIPDPNNSWFTWGGGIITLLAVIAYVRRSVEALMDGLET